MAPRTTLGCPHEGPRVGTATPYCWRGFAAILLGYRGTSLMRNCDLLGDSKRARFSFEATCESQSQPFRRRVRGACGDDRKGPYVVRMGVRFLQRNVKSFLGGLVCKAHRLVYLSTLGLRVIKERRRGYVQGYPASHGATLGGSYSVSKHAEVR